MKKTTRLFLNMALAATMFAGYSLVRAQDQNPSADDQGGSAPAEQGDHKDWGKDRLEHLKDKLGLTDDQADKLKAAFKKQEEANKPLRDQEKIDLDTLRQKIDTKASDADIKDALDKLKTDRKQAQDAQERSQEKIKTILSPTQQAKWVLEMDHGPRSFGRWDGKKDDGKHPKKGKGGEDSAKPAPDDAAAPAPTSAQ